MTKEIGGIKLAIAPFPAMEALRIQTRLGRLIGSSFSGLSGVLQKGDGKVMDANIDGAAVAQAIAGLFSSLSEEEWTQLVFRLLRGCSFYLKRNDGQEILVSMDSGNPEEVFNQVFQGKLMSVYLIIFEVLKENYPDFFEKLRGIGSDGITAFSSKLRENTEG